MRKYKKLLLIGIILGVVSLIGLAIFISMPMANPDATSTFRWVCVGVDAFFVILLLIASFLIRKGISLKADVDRNNYMEETEKQLKEILDRKYKELEESKNTEKNKK